MRPKDKIFSLRDLANGHYFSAPMPLPPDFYTHNYPMGGCCKEVVLYIVTKFCRKLNESLHHIKSTNYMYIVNGPTSVTDLFR